MLSILYLITHKNLFYLCKINTDDVLKTPKSSKNDCSTGYNIPVSLIKQLAKYIASPLTYINNCIKTHIFQSQWKIGFAQFHKLKYQEKLKITDRHPYYQCYRKCWKNCFTTIDKFYWKWQYILPISLLKATFNIDGSTHT